MESVQEYLETQVLTATPYRLHLMVVDGALKFARQGLLALEREDWETLELALSRSRDCVTELMGGLREDPTSDVIATQKSLFSYVIRSLAMADPLRNATHIQNAIRILEVHRETWLDLGGRLSENAAAAVPAPHSRSWTT